MGDYVETRLASAAVEGRDLVQTFILNIEDTALSCVFGDPEEKLKVGKLASVVFPALNHDGISDISVLLEFGKVQITRAQAEGM
jgi:hypothetical protein